MFPICRSDFPLNWQNKWELSRILPEQYVSISLPKLTSAVRAVSTQSWPFSCRHPGWGTTVSGKLTSMEQFGQQNSIHTDFYGIPEKWCYIARPMQSPASHPSSYSTQSYHRIELLVYFAAHHSTLSKYFKTHCNSYMISTPWLLFFLTTTTALNKASFCFVFTYNPLHPSQLSLSY